MQQLAGAWDALKFGGHGLLPCCQNRFFELMKANLGKSEAEIHAMMRTA